MKTQNKHIISYLLLILLLAPASIKVFDGIFHHHEHFVCVTNHTVHFHEFEEICPILDFELSLQIVYKLFIDSPKFDFKNNLITLKQFTIPHGELKYSFQLRAPPSFYK